MVLFKNIKNTLFLQKLARRKWAMETSESLTTEQKNLLKKCLIFETMSPEVSDDENDSRGSRQPDEVGRKLTRRPILWRSDDFEAALQSRPKMVEENIGESEAMMLPRVCGALTATPIPSGIPEWSVRQ